MLKPSISNRLNWFSCQAIILPLLIASISPWFLATYTISSRCTERMITILKKKLTTAAAINLGEKSRSWTLINFKFTPMDDRKCMFKQEVVRAHKYHFLVKVVGWQHCSRTRVSMTLYFALIKKYMVLSFHG